MGWGYTQPNTSLGHAGNILQEINLPVLDPSHCENVDVFNAKIELCIGDLQGGKSTCTGDSGGPLICLLSGGIWVIEGLVSYRNSELCAQPNSPTIFTKVLPFLPWIKTVIGKINF